MSNLQINVGNGVSVKVVLRIHSSCYCLGTRLVLYLKVVQYLKYSNLSEEILGKVERAASSFVCTEVDAESRLSCPDIEAAYLS